MLQARQKALRERVAQLEKTLKDMEGMDASGDKTKHNYDQVQDHLAEAIDQMDELDEKLTEAFYAPDKEDDKLREALDLLPLAVDGLRAAEWKLQEKLQQNKKYQNLEP